MKPRRGATLNFRFWPIVLKKSCWGDGRNFLGPLMPFARGDVRDHIVSHKNDQRASYGRYAVLQWWSRLKSEIFGVVQFSTFATLSAQSRYCISMAALGGEADVAKVVGRCHLLTHSRCRERRQTNQSLPCMRQHNCSRRVSLRVGTRRHNQRLVEVRPASSFDGEG